MVQARGQTVRPRSARSTGQAASDDHYLIRDLEDAALVGSRPFLKVPGTPLLPDELTHSCRLPVPSPNPLAVMSAFMGGPASPTRQPCFCCSKDLRAPARRKLEVDR